MLLCEVALGEIEERLSADSLLPKTLAKGKHSCLGRGKVEPNPKESIFLDKDVEVPLGKLCNTNVTNPHGYTLQYNEAIVYDTKQIRFRYLLRVK